MKKMTKVEKELYRATGKKIDLSKKEKVGEVGGFAMYRCTGFAEGMKALLENYKEN